MLQNFTSVPIYAVCFLLGNSPAYEFYMLAPTRAVSPSHTRPMSSIWVVVPHSLFLYSDPPLPSHPPSDWLRLFSSQTFSRINTPTFSTQSFLLRFFRDFSSVVRQMSGYTIQSRGTAHTPLPQARRLHISAWQTSHTSSLWQSQSGQRNPDSQPTKVYPSHT